MTKLFLVCVIFLFKNDVGSLANTISETNINDNNTSNTYCEETITYIGGYNLTWKKTLIGTTIYPNEFCSDENGEIPHRDCGRSYNSSSAEWTEVIGDCSGNFRRSNLTNPLHQILVQYAISGLWNFELLAKISYKIPEFRCIDLYLISKALYYMTIEEFPPRLFEYFPQTFDNVLEVLAKLNDSCHPLNVTTYILGTVNVFFNRVTEEKNDIGKIKMSNFILQISNPFLDRIVGLGLYKNNSESFRNCITKEILAGESYNDISMQDLELFAYVSKDFVEILSRNMNEEETQIFKIIIIVFRDGKLFDFDENTRVISRVVGFSIPGFCGQRNMLFNSYLRPAPSLNNDNNSEWFIPDKVDVYFSNVIDKCPYSPVNYAFLLELKERATAYTELSMDENKYYLSYFYNQRTLSDLLNNIPILKNYAKSLMMVTENSISTLWVPVKYGTFSPIIEPSYKSDFLLLVVIFIVCTLFLLGLLAIALALTFIKKQQQREIYTI